MSLIVLIPKRTILALNHVIWAINCENRSRGSSWALVREKKTGQDRTGQEKKLQKGYISPICREAPTEAMYMKICVVGGVLDVITCAKFQNEIFRGYKFTGGRIFHFSYWFWMGLTTVQRYCAACDVPFLSALEVVYDMRYTNRRLLCFTLLRTYLLTLAELLHVTSSTASDTTHVGTASCGCDVTAGPTELGLVL